MLVGRWRLHGRERGVWRVHCVRPHGRTENEDHPEEAHGGQMASDVGREDRRST